MTDEWLTNYTYDAAGNLTLSAGSGVPSTTRTDTYNATQQLVTSFTRTGQQPTSRIQTTTDTRYDALGRRIWIKKVSQCSGTPEDTQHFCRTSYVRRTAWDGDQEIAEFQGGEEDSGTLACGTPRPMQQGLPSEDECPLWGQTRYVHGGSVDSPLAVVRSNYREYQYVNSQWILRTFPTFALYPLWNARGEPDLATSITGKNTVCVTTDTPPCAQDFGWPAGMTPYMQQQFVKLSWLGSLLDAKRDAGLATGLTYLRNRYVDGRTGRFSQPDPIGLAGGFNSSGYADGDPVNRRDPFGLFADTLVVGDASGRRPDLKNAVLAAMDSAEAGSGQALEASLKVHGLYYERTQDGGFTYRSPEGLEELAAKLGIGPGRLAAGSTFGRTIGCPGVSSNATPAWTGAHEIGHQRGILAGVSLAAQRDPNSLYLRPVSLATAARGMRVPHSECAK